VKTAVGPSNQNLRPEIVRLMDAIQGLRFESAALTDRRRTFEILHIRSATRHLISHPAELGPARFLDIVHGGIFDDPGWSGEYDYQGWGDASANTWSAAFYIDIDPSVECVDGNVLVDALGLTIVPKLAEQAPPLNREIQAPPQPDASAMAPAISSLTPSIKVGFRKGCLTNISVYGVYLYKEISDEKARD
jgi:hypothetical protein